jgi:hypothetical protein
MYEHIWIGMISYGFCGLGILDAARPIPFVVLADATGIGYIVWPGAGDVHGMIFDCCGSKPKL